MLEFSAEYMVRIPKGMRFQRLPVVLDSESILIHNRGWYYTCIFVGIPLGIIFVAGWVYVTSQGQDLGFAMFLLAIALPLFLFVLFRHFASESIRIEPSRGLLVFTFHRALKSRSINTDITELFTARCRVRTTDRKPNRYGLLIGVKRTGCAILYSCDKDPEVIEQALAGLPGQIIQALIDDKPTACIQNC